MALFAEYPLAGGAVDVPTLGAAVADLGQAGCVKLAASLRGAISRATFLLDRACAEAVQDGELLVPATSMGAPYSRSASVADLATSCHLTQRPIWYRVHRCRDLSENLPGTQTQAAAGTLDHAMVDTVRSETQPLTPAGRHRLDQIIAGRPDPLTPRPNASTGSSRSPGSGARAPAATSPPRPHAEFDHTTPWPAATTVPATTVLADHRRRPPAPVHGRTVSEP